MKNLLFAFALLVPFLLNAQTYELGIQVGASNYLGDLAPSVAFGETHPHGAIFLKKNTSSGFFSWRYSFSYGSISGSDANFPQNQIRNLDFRTTLLEAGLQLEFNFQKFLIGLRAKKFSPYVTTGIGVSYFDPEGSFNGGWQKLRPLSTEGQGIGGAKAYSIVTPVIPVGGGLKWAIARRWNFTVFTEFRYSFSDYLDDVSTTYFDSAELMERKGEIAVNMADKSIGQVFITNKERGNPDRSDWYIFSGCTLSYWFLDRNCFNFQ